MVGSHAQLKAISSECWLLGSWQVHCSIADQCVDAAAAATEVVNKAADRVERCEVEVHDCVAAGGHAHLLGCHLSFGEVPVGRWQMSEQGQLLYGTSKYSAGMRYMF